MNINTQLEQLYNYYFNNNNNYFSDARFYLDKYSNVVLVLLDDNNIYASTYNNGLVQLIGECQYHIRQKNNYTALKIDFTRVEENYRNHGISRCMFHYAENYCKTHNIDNIMLDSLPDKINLYRHFGFIRNELLSRQSIQCEPMIKRLCNIKPATISQDFYIKNPEDISIVEEYNKMLNNDFDNCI